MTHISPKLLEEWLNLRLEQYRATGVLTKGQFRALGYWCVKLNLFNALPPALVAELAMLGYLTDVIKEA
jgi:hypothetical protein